MSRLHAPSSVGGRHALCDHRKTEIATFIGEVDCKSCLAWPKRVLESYGFEKDGFEKVRRAAPAAARAKPVLREVKQARAGRASRKTGSPPLVEMPRIGTWGSRDRRAFATSAAARAIWKILEPLELDELVAIADLRLFSSRIDELRREAAAWTPAPGRELVETRSSAAGGSYCLERVRCGKAKCRCASSKGKLHGPYWYAYVRSSRTGKASHRYVGKPGSPAAAAAGL